MKTNFRNQNDVGAAGDSAVQRDPARVTAHHFQNHDAAVTRCGGVQTVARISDRGDGRIETERARGGFKIVVDCFAERRCN